MISSQLIKYLENNCILYELQHGSWHKRSCETHLMPFMNDVTKTYDRGKQTEIDITKAFDTDPFDRLEQKLKWYA